jgi:hydroxysqualene synthase
MTGVNDLASGKGHRDENFPVASVLIHPRHRPIILAFYRFARAADDVADHPTAEAEERLKLLDSMQAGLIDGTGGVVESLALRSALASRSLSPRHALDLLEAFRRDVTKSRYANWDELMDYCRYSAMPVGRFVLDVHGESEITWPASDSLCAALQVINHLQDCSKDYRLLDRVYIPLDALDEVGLAPDVLKRYLAPTALREVIRNLAQRTAGLLAASRMFCHQIRDPRLATEVAVIQALAEDLNLRLMEQDPLSGRVHHSTAETIGIAVRAATRFAAGRLLLRGSQSAFARHP